MGDRLFLYEKVEEYRMDSILSFPDIPEIIKTGLAKKIELRGYQKESIQNFLFYYENESLKKNKQVHTLFHMATGSGKTVIMASLILYLYTKGYRKFMFFVNQTNILEKTKRNFTDSLSSKYLFNDEIKYLGNKINIKMVDNFSGTNFGDDIEIVFTTTQKLHMDLFLPKENSLTFNDFEDNKVVFISDESHHINSSTKKKSKSEEEAINSWEYSVTRALISNRNSIMLEFTATADLKDKNVEAKYKDKIIYNYPLIKFRKSGYTKDFKNFGTDSSFWDRTLIALVMSEYRRFLFSDLKLNIKPVVMFKFQRKIESSDFYNDFFEKLGTLTSYQIINLYNVGEVMLSKALNYFKSKDETFELLEHSIKDSFAKEKTITMNDSKDDIAKNQLLVNSLEDENNNIRLIFVVDKLTEGWDVLNLYDIVRLHDNRQGSGKAGKVGKYTIKEAQLIGRAARYCPFSIGDENNKFKRKYDNDLENDNRILETMYFHSKNDSSYIAELRRALQETGLQDKEPIEIEYKLKEEFKQSLFYKSGYIFSNKRVLKSRKTVSEIEDIIKNKVFKYSENTGYGSIVSLTNDDNYKLAEKKVEQIEIKSIFFKEVDYNILLGASERFNELKFNVVKTKYPQIKTLKEFLTSDKYLGNVMLEIKFNGDLSGKILYKACLKAFEKIAAHIVSLKPEYEGTREFTAKNIKAVIKDKKIYLSSISENGGKGVSQNDCINSNYRLDLKNEDWYVFDDNYGTSEEKLVIKYFKTRVEPKLREKNVEFYVIRNERVSDVAIYSFNSGERFEPDFLLFIRKKGLNNYSNSQVYIEPKGNNLLKEDKWKENFLAKIEGEHKITGLFVDDFRIVGLPFFNEANRIIEFTKAIDEFISKI